MSLYIEITYQRLIQFQLFLVLVRAFLIYLLISLLDQTVEKQTENLKIISSRYELDKKKWTEAIHGFQEKVKVNDQNASRS